LQSNDCCSRNPTPWTVTAPNSSTITIGCHATGHGHVRHQRAHVAFAAPGRDAVDAFYAAALANGGRDNGPPGLRPEYHPGYYAAFVLDPDGNNVEAVHHDRS